MKKLSFSSFLSTLAVIAFCFAIQTSAQAQLTVFNNTPCDMLVWTKMADNTTILPCDGCPSIVGGGLTFVASGNFAVIGANPACGVEFWQNFFWFDTFGAVQGQSTNPVVNPQCGTNILGPCGGTSANWTLTTLNGTGPAFITIN